ncbi:hypothetical protein HA402_010759 [Bradysia odoriphaga]|nr:hypothetical protein HA402_010759 [Bradysia odoriphaga]
MGVLMKTMRSEECAMTPMGVPPSKCISIALSECNDTIRSLSSLNASFNELIRKLRGTVHDAEKLKNDLLISRTAGTGATLVGETLKGVGAALSAFTRGASDPILSGSGRFLAAVGRTTNFISCITEICVTVNRKIQIQKLIDDCRMSTGSYVAKGNQLEKSLQKCDYHESRYFADFGRMKRVTNIEMWLRAGHLYKDTIVAPEHLSTT